MKKITKIHIQWLAICLLATMLTACQDDTFRNSGKVVEGVPVNASLNFATIPEADIVVTRADNSLSELTRMAIFVYSGESFQQLVRTADRSLQITFNRTEDNGVYYTAKFQTTSGTKNLLAVANNNTMEDAGGYWESLENIASQASNGELTFEELKSQIIGLRESLYTNGNMQPISISSSSQMLISGWNSGVIINTNGQVQNYGTNVNGENVVLCLDRSMAHITFNIPEKVEGAKGTFIPTSYRVYNVPVKSFLTNTNKNPVPENGEGNTSFEFTHFAQTNVRGVDNGKYYFDFYMPENIYETVTESTNEEGNTINIEDNYHNRDTWTGEPSGALPEQKQWTFAPQTSTFVVISGTYEEYNSDGTPHYTGNVDYTIHLGDFSKASGNIGNFSVERNSSYTYTVKVMDVDRIVVEAQKKTDKEYQQGSEGSIYDYSQSKYAYQLDAHYEQVFLEYNLTEIAKNLDLSNNTSLDDAIANALILVIQSEAMDYENSIETADKPYTVRNKRGTLRPYKIYMDARGETNPDAAQKAKANVLKGQGTGTTPTAGFDYKWIEFRPQEGTDLAAYPGVSDWSREDLTGFANPDAYGGKPKEESKCLMDVYDVIVEMGKAVKQIYNNGQHNGQPTAPSSDDSWSEGQIIIKTNDAGQYVARFTAFVNEYYYYKHPLTGEKVTSWSVFTNKMPREMIIAMSTDISKDGNSSYSTLHSYISQLSIQTFYNSRTSNINGFGIETYNETPLYTFGNYKTTNLNRTDGRKNQLNFIHAENNLTWGTYIDSQFNGWTNTITSDRNTHVLSDDVYKRQAAYIACLSRNRDLNGNNKIDDNEVRWFLPALNEYIRMGIGAGAISNAAQLYTGDKALMEKILDKPDKYPLTYISDGSLYFTSSENEARVYWAVEKGSYSAADNRWAGGIKTAKPIRCIRLLPKNNEYIDISTIEDIHSDPTYVYDKYTHTFTFIGRLEESLYRERVDGRLNPHDEDNRANSFYQKIVVAKDYEKDKNGNYKKFTMGQIIRANNYDSENPCANYHEEGDGNATWRVPNLVEFSAMHAEELVQNGDACCTQFSNQSVRYGFRMNQDQIQCWGGETGNSLTDTFSVRCVRDVE